MGKGKVSGADPPQEEDIWKQILQEATRKNTNIVESRTLVFLGDRNCGKSTLLARFQGQDVSETTKGIAMSYSFIDVYEDDIDEPIGRNDVWQLEGEISHCDLLQYALNEHNIQNAAVIITVDFSQPWNIVESLRRWLNILSKHVNIIRPKVKVNLEELVRVSLQNYQEPTQSGHSLKKRKKRALPQTMDSSNLPQLDDITLTHNLGIPIIIVCCKSDSVVMLEKDFDYKDEHFDYIQAYLRRLCLNYGASLVYTSSKKDINCELLMDYIEHKLFGFEFRHTAQLLEKDSIFVPAGWDNKSKVLQDFSNQKICKDPDELYENVIRKPNIIKMREVVNIPVISAEQDQDFLQRHRNAIEKDSGHKNSDFFKTSPYKNSVPIFPDSPTSTETTKKTVETTASSTGSPVSPDKPISSGSDKAVLANFFSSLMAKDRPSRNKLAIPPLGASSNSEQLRRDAAKELERIKKALKK
jgi:dynein light intermediate chain 1